MPRASQRRPLRAIVFEVASEPMFLLLLAAGAVYLLVGDRFEALVLTGFVLAIMAITIFQERRTDNALAALRELSSPRALVMRDGSQVRIAGHEVVRGDLLLVGEGDRVPADGELLDAHDLAIDESMLTGESIPVARAAGDAVHAGTLIVQGQGMVRVSAIGSRTEMGRIGESLAGIALESSPLRREMAGLTRRIAIAGVLMALALAAGYWWLRGDAADAVLAGIALAMSLLPQEFAVIMIIFFAFAARRLGRLNVLTRRLDAIETLGETSVLCVDKTGTLTQNRMDVVALLAGIRADLDDANANGVLSPLQAGLLRYAVLASEREPHDAMEKAILRRAAAGGASQAVPPGWTLVQEYELSPQLPAMTHAWDTHEAGTPATVAIKGAPEAVAGLCLLSADEAAQVARASAQLAERGLRVLGIAKATHDRALPWPDSPQDFRFHWLGLLALADPLRPEVPAAIAQCRRAGIRVVMITGDHPRTALAIAREAGLPASGVVTGAELAQMDAAAFQRAVREVDVFARVKPEQKLALVNALKQQGDVVAMTGDGVNDAPALKAAHIGVAMGQRGTDVAREAAALVLLKDDFASIVQAIRMGRSTFANMRQAMVYTVAVHIPIAGLAVLPLLFGLPLMLAPVHIAFLELVIDPACSIVFEAEDAGDTLMQQPPRTATEPLLSRFDALRSVVYGLLTTIGAFGAYVTLMTAGHDTRSAATSAFVLLVVANALLILPNRHARPGWRWVWSKLPPVSLWIIIGTLTALWIITHVEPVARAFRFAPLPPILWIASALAGAAMLPLYLLARRLLGSR
jgi:Ca2+-transporting ATPase